MAWTYFLIIIGLVALYWTFSFLCLVNRADLTPLPGPKWASFTPWYRVYRLWSGQAPAFYLDIHEQYGPIVRTGPNTVSIADPTTIPAIYGISSNYLKVSALVVLLESILIPFSPSSTSQ